MSRRLHERPHNRAPRDDQVQPDIDSWDYHYHKIITSLQGTQQEKEAVVRKRILRYFGEFKLDSQSYLSIRCDVDYNFPGLQIISHKIVLFGIDYMNIEKGKNYFSGFVTNIRRIDDSHFMVEFRSESECLAALNKYRTAINGYFSSQDVFKNSNKGWVQLRPYKEFIFERKLLARFATNLDRCDTPLPATRQSCTFAYSEAKRKFMKSLKEDVEIRQRDRENRINSHKFSEDRSSSTSRSRQKNYQGVENRQRNSRWDTIESKGREGLRTRNYSRSRSRSRQTSLERRHESKILDQQKVKQCDFKFQLYIQRRDNKNKFSIDLQPTHRALAYLNMDSNVQPHALTLTQTQISPATEKGKSDKSNETKNDEFDFEVISGPSNKNNINNNRDATQMEFEQYLERLKLQDSKNDYSAFDLDEMEL